MQESYFESMDIDEMNLYDTGLVDLFFNIKKKQIHVFYQA